MAKKKQKRATKATSLGNGSPNPSNLSALQLRTESDVEQKLIISLLVEPMWLGLPRDSVHTKDYLAPTILDKSAGRRFGYYPDYSVWISGVPALIVEAKSPHESAEQGFREAQLYAHDLNRRYPPNVNPVRFIVSSNGKSTLYGFWDSTQHNSLSLDDCRVGTLAANKFREFLQRAKLIAHSNSINEQLRKKLFWRPINLIGGERRLDIAVPVNTFAYDLFPLIKMFFESDAPDQLDAIIEKAYVASDEVTQYDRLLEIYLQDRLPEAKDPTARPIFVTKHDENALSDTLRRFRESNVSQGQLQLVIGSVGAGKSLFLKRYHGFLQPVTQRETLYWAFLDFNTAPDNLEKIENWVCRTFVESFGNLDTRFDLYSAENLRRIFAPDIKKRDKGAYAQLKESNPDEYEKLIAVDLAQWQDNPEKFATSISRYLIGDAGKGIVAVFDNVDRRDREQQLRLFQVAQWFKNHTRAFCILALRDETYERYKNEPPLDAFLNAVHFYIRPPRFTNVVRKRLELTFDYLAKSATKINTFELSNGLKITYPNSEIGEFLKSLYVELFDPRRKIGTVLEALTGKNVRAALKMFTDIIISGHLDEKAILSTVAGGREFHITEATVIKILMRTGYKYFAEDHGYISNVFNAVPDWERPSNFLFVEALAFLQERRKSPGDIGLEGYFTVDTVVSHLSRMGFVPNDITDALSRMLERGLIQADHMRPRGLKEDDFVKIHASGFVHLRILTERLEYLAAILPDTYLADKDTALKLSEIWDIGLVVHDVSVRKKTEAVKVFRNYLVGEYEELAARNPFFREYSGGSRSCLQNVGRAIEFADRVLAGTPAATQ